MSTCWIDYFQIWGQSLNFNSRVWCALYRISITTKKICSPMQCFFCKFVQMSNFGRLKSANGHFWINYFPIFGKSLKSISRIWWALFRSSVTTKRYAFQCSAFSINLCKGHILVGRNQQMDTFRIDYFQICKSLKSNSRIWCALFRSSISTKIMCFPMRCFFCNLMQMSNFVRLKSGNEHILGRLFPYLRQIPKIHLAYVVCII